MIYFDNAATSRPKPDCVYDAFNYYIREIGASPGRGSYKLGIEASRMLYKSRKTVASFFSVAQPSNVIFTKNSTEAINLYLNGTLQKGDHVIISSFEHNAVLRPLHRLMQKGVIEYSVLPPEITCGDFSHLADYIRTNTKLAVITLASNLTGQYVFNRHLAEAFKAYGLTVFVDASQGAGKMLINMANDNIDVLAFTGHKDLLALPGVGGLISKQELIMEPLIQGGTGISGDSYVNPLVYPEAYESGTLNMPAIWSLKISLEYIQANCVEIANKEQALITYLIDKMINMPNITIYNIESPRVSTVCFNIDGKSSNEVVEYLSKHDICVRGGIHCAIIAHKTIGTVETGAIRVSLNSFNTMGEIDMFIEILNKIG